ncbi:MAG: hypothetical protein ACRD3Y_11140, partial [Bryobacteraceae bacterium]
LRRFPVAHALALLLCGTDDRFLSSFGSLWNRPPGPPPGVLARRGPIQPLGQAVEDVACGTGVPPHNK